MRRGRDPSRTPSRARRPVWDNPRGQLPGTGIRGDGENLYDRRSTQRVRGTSPGSAVLTGEASSQVRKDLAYFQIQEIVFHLSILLQRPYHH